jgi:hypothetical protein
MSHQAFPKTTGTTTDGYVLTYSSTDGYWASKPLPGSGWQTVYEVNFQAQPTQSFSGNGNVTIDSKTWTVENFAAATSLGVVNGTGLQFSCNTTNTDYNNGTRNGLILSTKISNLYPQFSLTNHKVRVTAWVSASNADQNFEFIVFGLEDIDTPMGLSYTLFKGFQNGAMLAQKVTIANGSSANLDTTNTGDDVLQVTLDSPAAAEVRTGIYSGGFPSQENMRSRRYYMRNAGEFTPAMSNSQDVGIVFSAITNNSNGNLVVSIGRLKVEAFIPGSGNITSAAGGDLSGTFPNPTVSRIQTIPVNSAAPSDGYVLTYVGGDGYWAPRQGTPSRYTPTDSNTIINWKLDETSSPYANSGAGSALNLTTFIGTPASITGIFNKALGCSGTIISSGNSSVNEVTGTSLSVSVWVRARSFASFGTIFNKAYRNNNSWSSPFVSIYLSFSNTGDGSWGPAITTGAGVLTQPFVGGAYRVTLGVWTLLSYTYDGSNLRSYINGALANTTAVTGAIDYGTHGPWDIGGVSNAGVNQFWDGHIDDLRIENVVRSQAYFEAMYKAGVNQRD